MLLAPSLLVLLTTETALLTIARGDSVFNAIDGIGYVFMCFSTFVAAPAFDQSRLQRWIGRLFVVNGMLAVPIFITYFINRSFIWLAARWSITITATAILLAIHCRRVGGRWASGDEP